MHAVQQYKELFLSTAKTFILKISKKYCFKAIESLRNRKQSMFEPNQPCKDEKSLEQAGKSLEDGR